jgi:hypothetical protein
MTNCYTCTCDHVFQFKLEFGHKALGWMNNQVNVMDKRDMPITVRN